MQSTQEIGKDINGFPGRKISNLGRVLGSRGKIRKLKNIYTNGNKKLQPYLTVRFTKLHCGCYIHRLVAEAFIPNPTSFKEVNRKDRNKHNNKVDNLEWCTRKTNCVHQHSTKPFKS